ncbi:MAG TPA: WhiB family transcriptional regulator [Trebonia sp.]|jgi:WhiB family redox-sensing transcriptional regulator
MIEYATDWRAAACCLTADPDLFFPVAVGTAAIKQITQARRVCAGCPVRQQCLDFAMRTREPAGIWGGTTPEERVKELRARNRRRLPRGPGQEASSARAS